MLIDLWKTGTKNDCCAYECKHCGMLMKFPWKVKGTYENNIGGVGGSCHSGCAVRYLKNHCDESGRNSVKERLLEKVQNELSTTKMLQQRLSTSKRN